MSQLAEVWVDKSDFRKTHIHTAELPSLKDGEVLVRIDKFGLTANNVSYALTGDMIGYWGYYPAPDNWGKVPTWGCADVIESRCSKVPVGERLWGVFPMSSHAVLQPGAIKQDSLIDFAEHRSTLPALYNGYRRMNAEPEIMQSFENERCLLFPLFMTGYVLYDYLIDNEFFGAKQVLIGSVSSKTGFGLAKQLFDDPNVSQKVVGITSARNVAFAKSLNCCDQIVEYGSEADIDATQAAAYVDMSGDARLTTTLHNHLGDNMVESAMVGASHWETSGRVDDLPGAKPTFFFAPGQIEKREKEWGAGVPMMKGMEASMKVAASVKDIVSVDWTYGPEALAELWVELLDNNVPASRGLMVSVNEQSR